MFFLLSACTGIGNTPPVEETEQNKSEEIKEVNNNKAQEEPEELEEEPLNYEAEKERIIEQYEGVTPTSWGENVKGVITEIDTDEKIIALTFDACDGTPNSFDEELINFLIEEDIPATLFIAGQWIEGYEEEFMELSDNSLFEIANHGYDHKPLSISGESAYGIQGTQNVREAFEEIFKNQVLIQEMTGETPKYFRSGTAFYDEISVEIASELGLETVNYNVLGDAGGTFNKSQIVESLEMAEPGSIYLFHMNQPQGEIARGVKEGVLELKDQGYEFVQLQEVDELLK